MLTKIVLLNSANYAKAIIHFDATGIQIVGENKIGKTTLINSLNFLYVLDKEKMSFDSRGGTSTYDYKQSLDHFFPVHNQSFILFECLKPKAGGYFCVLVKRKISEEDVEYFKINKQFEEEDFKDSNGNLKKFEEIRKFFTIQDLLREIKDKKEVFQQVYSKDKKQNCFLWLTDKVKRKDQVWKIVLPKSIAFYSMLVL